MDKWDRFQEQSQRAFSDFGFRQFRVYNYSESYDSDTGGSVWTESEDANSPVEMDLSEPDEGDMDVDAGGQASEEEVQFWLRDDTGVTIAPAGDGNGKPTVVEDTATGQRYTVTNKVQQQDGTLRLSGVER